MKFAILCFSLFALAVPGASQTKSNGRAKAAQSAASAFTAQSSVETDGLSGRLPVKRVVLYKNGVGYFEHRAHVRGTQDLNIDFTSAQLNDVLKSLTAVDLGDGRITSVRYNSIAPLEERLRSLRLPFGETITRSEFLTAMRGSRVEVHSGTNAAVGRLLSVESAARPDAHGNEMNVTVFSVITDSGEMKNFELGPGTSVRIADHDLDEEIGRYLNLVGSARARDVRRMTLTASGSGDRDIFVSYISEVPIWKSTYRIILPDKPGEKPLLQGWAIVDNTIGEDWKDVQLSLIAGAPQSFIQDISQPFYARRPVVPLPQAAMLTPQTQEPTVTVTNGPPAAMPAGVAGGVGVGSGGGGGVEQKAYKQFIAQNANGRQFYETAALAPGALAKQTSEAEGKSIGDFFEYDVKQKISIGKNQSALVPILQSRIEAEKVTLWSPDSDDDENSFSVPLRALWIKNTSGQVLDSGTFNILEGDTFAGEGILETIHPDERRLLSYAADTAVHVKHEEDSSEMPYSRIKIAHGVMMLTREEHKTTTYEIRDADKDSRVVVVEYPLEEDWELTKDTPKPEETTASYDRFRVPVDAGKTAKLTVKAVHSDEASFVLTNLNSDEVDLLVKQQRVTPALQQAFNQILGQKNQIAGLDQQINQRTQETRQISEDQNRIRENMKALKGSAEERALIQRYTGELDKQEDRLATLRSEMEDLRAKRAAASAELNRMIMAINLDESF